MSQENIRRCIHQGEDYLGAFEKEPDTYCCKECFDDGSFKYAKKVIELKTLQEVSI